MSELYAKIKNLKAALCIASVSPGHDISDPVDDLLACIAGISADRLATALQEAREDALAEQPQPEPQSEWRVKEFEAQGKQPHGICAEPPYQRRLREERDEAQQKLRELARLAERTAHTGLTDDDLKALRQWLDAHPELWAEQEREDAK